MIPTKEQIQWLWEQCGLHKDGNFWYDANGKQLSEEVPPIDLNNLFKYAVPKIPALDFVEFKNRERGWIAVVRGFGLEERAFYYNDPALALFWAIYKALGGKE